MVPPYSNTTYEAAAAGDTGAGSEHREERNVVIRHQSPVDKRPFQARAVLERQESLEAQYGSIGIDEVVAALRQIKAAGERVQQSKAA